MPNFSTYEATVAFAKQANLSMAQSAKVAIFNDPTNQIYDIKAKETLIREIETVGAGDYTGVWDDGFGNVESEYVRYYAPYDRSASFAIDSLQEAQSFVEGATPTLNLAGKEFMTKHQAPEIDSVVLARYAVQAGIKKLTTEWQIDKAHILDTLTSIEAEISNAGYDGEIVTYLSTDANMAFEQALLEKNVLASDVVIKRKMTKEEVAEGFEALEIEIRCRKFNNMLIIPVPNDRMCGAYIMLDGRSAGQEAGGVIPEKNVSTYHDNKIIAIPLPAAYCNIRHIVAELAVPASIDVADYTENIALANEKLFGTVEIEHIGVNQLSDGFKFNTRTVYGGDIFEKYRDLCVVVKTADGAISGIEATRIITDLSAVTAADTFTKTLQCAPLNMTAVPTVESTATGKATVAAAAGTNPGEVVLTVTKVAAGDTTIKIYADAAKTNLLGELPVTMS